MSRDSIYQQLRGHLAYLKLAAAAEALPAHLEAARRDDAAHTPFLEGLLRVEVEATEQRRWNSRMRFANFPTPWQLEDFDFSAQPSIDQKLVRELATGAYLADATNVLHIRPARSRKNHARGHPGPSRGRRRPQGVLHHRSRPSSPMPQQPLSKDAGPPPCGSSPAQPCS